MTTYTPLPEDSIILLGVDAILAGRSPVLDGQRAAQRRNRPHSKQVLLPTGQDTTQSHICTRIHARKAAA
jgi:hypothetical protein